MPCNVCNVLASFVVNGTVLDNNKKFYEVGAFHMLRSFDARGVIVFNEIKWRFCFFGVAKFSDLF